MSEHVRLDFPFGVDATGRTAITDRAGHVRDMIEQFLFTAQGERVNRHDFGSGLHQLVFAPAGDELAAALQFTVRSGLQRWLVDHIDVADVQVAVDDGVLRVLVRYVLRATGENRTETFESEI